MGFLLKVNFIFSMGTPAFCEKDFFRVVDRHIWFHFEGHFRRHYSFDFERYRIIVASSGLFLVDFNHVVLLHLKSLWSFIIINSPPIKKKAERGDWHPHPL